MSTILGKEMGFFLILRIFFYDFFEGEKIYPSKDVTKDEMKEFLENLPQEAFTSIKKFFDTLPRLKQEVEVENPKTKVKSKITFEGLQDFFV